MEQRVRAKKFLGQHFLRCEDTAMSIAEAICLPIEEKNILFPPRVLEIGPGTGMLTKYLMDKENIELKLIEIDRESVDYLSKKYPLFCSENRLILGDFLRLPADFFFPDAFCIIGNFPYHISSQILFRTLEFKNHIPILAGMFQKEVAERVCAKPGNKTYGILSVLIQAFYNTEYLFSVEPHLFTPPPKVQSGVIRIIRNSRMALPCDEKLFFSVVKTAFNQRRKTLRNALKPLLLEGIVLDEKILTQRAEQLSVDDFISICLSIEKA